ncbi:MAG: HEAT repeat domain-containing protein [Candidatus Rokuibacteriota bacterium]
MASAVPQVVESFLKDLLGARKAIKLYPAGNPLATDWLHRLRRSVDSALKDGLPSTLRIAPGRFEWDGGQLPTPDRALEAFRFDLETRRITELSIDAGVETWELQEFLTALNVTYQEVEAAGGVSALLERGKVVHVVVRGPLWDGRDAGNTAAGASTTKLDLLEAAVNAILELVAAEFRELTYDRRRLYGWFTDLAQPGDRAEVVFQAVQTLLPLVDAEADREVRYRTLTESVVSLPDPLRATLLTGWVLPGVRADLHILNLLTRFSGDEFAELTALIPDSALQALKADIEALPTEEWKKARLIEGLEDALAEKEVAQAPIGPLIADDDPALAKLRRAAAAAFTPDAVLEHGVRVLVQLMAATESETYPASLVDALEEAALEALGRGRLDVALRVLQGLRQPPELRPEWAADHQRALPPIYKRLGGRTQVALLAEPLRRGDRPDDVRGAADLLALLGRPAIGGFVGILADEEDPAVRTRLLEVVGILGAAAAPAMRDRVGDERWQVARSMVALLARLGDESAYEAVEQAAGHEHPQVRREIARALPALGGKRATRTLIGYLSDPDGDVRLTAIRLLGGLIDSDAVAHLRQVLATPTRSPADLLVKRSIITGLASIASPEAVALLGGIARRRLWPWQRNELTVRQLAHEALRTARPEPSAGPGA